MTARVYVDGFNLYYGALRGTEHKWLDLGAWAGRLLPGHDIDMIMYFTARITAHAKNPSAPTRQDAYLRALATLPRVEIVEGTFKSGSKNMKRDPRSRPDCCTSTPPCPCDCCAAEYARVIKTEEKGSDVNLAVHLVSDAYRSRYDVAVVISEDSDLQPAVDLVRSELGKRVIVVTPRNLKHMPLRGDEKRLTRAAALRASQFPAVLTGLDGREIRRPSTW